MARLPARTGRGKRQQIVIESQFDLMVLADSALLGHAVTNIVHNAMLHSPFASTIRIHARPTESQVELVIIDQGPGHCAGLPRADLRAFFCLEPRDDQGGCRQS
jgi:K+-sensing histidine kinase KdpD